MATRTRRSGSSAEFDHDARWRPRSRAGKACGYAFDGKICIRRGAHYCEPRADKVVAFFGELLVHTKGRWARRQFVLEDWQEHGIIRPVFGEVVWSSEVDAYVRRYRLVYIILGRKNGKSELAAGIVLYLLVGDDEESAEIYGAAKDTKQAGKVGEVVERMRQLSPLLSKRLGFNKNNRRVFDEESNSYYEVIPADAKGELGHNPHGVVIDEVLSQPNGDLWESLRTAAGARTQPLYVIISTETNEPVSFGATVIDEAERIAEDPRRAPHAFAYVRKTDTEADPWNEANWRHANPALGTFLSLQALREEALEAKNEPTKENSFRQYRLNQRVSQITRWMPLHLYDACGGPAVLEDDVLAGRRCWGGLDLSATSDLTALAWWFPDAVNEQPGPHQVLWRFWVPEAKIAWLSKHTGGAFEQWVHQGLITATEGDVVDYDVMHAQLLADHQLFAVQGLGLDKWNATGTANYCQARGIPVQLVSQTAAGLSAPMKELMRLTVSRAWNHQGHPVARWCFDSVEVKRDDQDNIRPVKPDRQKTAKRIDAVPAVVMAISGWQQPVEEIPAPQTAMAASGDVFRPSGPLRI
jgi:phage terminase large subunit-like protein